MPYHLGMPHNTATGALSVDGPEKSFGAARVLDRAGLRVPAGRVVTLGGATVGYPRPTG